MSNYNTISQIITSFSGNERNIVIPKTYLEITGDYPTAALLNQLIFWSDKSKRTDGYFYKKYDEWHDELLLSDYQIRRITKKLEEMNFITTALKKANGTPTKHYKINMEEIEKAIMKKLNNENSRNSTMDSKETKYSLDSKETKESLTVNYTDNYNSENTTDSVGQSLALIFNTFINVSQKVISDIEQSLEMIGDNAYPITEIVIEYTQNQNKGVGYLSGILFNFSKRDINTIEKAKEELDPKQVKKQNKPKKETAIEKRLREARENGHDTNTGT